VMGDREVGQGEGHERNKSRIAGFRWSAMNAVNLHKALYPAALLLIVAVQAWIFYVFSRFIIAGEGVGVYAAFLYLTALIVSALLWAASFYYQRGRATAVVFWGIALAMMPIILIQPVWWSAPVIGN